MAAGVQRLLVTDDASLTDFFADAEDEGDAAVAPAEPTYVWLPDDAVCPECEESVDRRWRDGDAFVCADCKDW